jgi:probable phosphoglycerate mutase
LILVRHGQTDDNAAVRHQVYTSPLSELGRAQARLVAERLRNVKADALYTSDLTRALQTAEPISIATGLAPRLDARLREHDVGDAKGLTPEEALAKYGDVYARSRADDFDVELPHGESRRKLLARAAAAVTEIATAHAGGRVIVVTHGGTLRCVLMHALAIPESHFPRIDTPNTGVNVFRFAGGTFDLVTWGDTRHLE